MNRNLLIVLGALLLVLAIVYGFRMLPGGDEENRSAEELVEIATTAADPQERQQAAARILRAPGGSTEVLKPLLAQSQDPEVRGIAISALAGAYEYESMPAILHGLEDPSPTVRADALRACEKMLNLKGFQFDPAANPLTQRQQIDRIKKEWEELKKSGLIDEWKRRLQNRKAGS